MGFCERDNSTQPSRLCVLTKLRRAQLLRLCPERLAEYGSAALTGKSV
ncbi:MAG TPA: hypothetical protein V6C95_04555 [Coleofasciculaceae cyanobacterium]